MPSSHRLPLIAALVGAVLATTSPAALASVSPFAAAPITTGTGARPVAVPELLPTRYLRGGPQFLSDGRIAWLEADGRDWGIRAGLPGRTAARTLVRGGLHHDSDDESGDSADDLVAWNFSAAGQTAVVAMEYQAGNSKAQSYVSSTDVRAYDLVSGKYRSLDTCSRREEGVPVSAPGATFATDGAHVAASLCSGTKIYDTTGDTPLVTLPDTVVALDLAGPYVATLSGGRLAVRAWATGTTLYATTLPVNVDQADFALQDDGALALVTIPSPASGGQSELTWHTPSTPDGTVLPVKPSTASVSARGGKAIVSVASLSGLGNVLTEIGPAAPELPLAFLGWGAATDFGYRDGRVAFGRGGCDGAGSVGLATGDATPIATDCPELRVLRAKRSGRRLGVSLTYRQGVTERLRITYRAAGRTVRFTAQGAQASQGLNATFRLPAWAAGKRATITVAYAGNTLFIPQTAQRAVRG